MPAPTILIVDDSQSVRLSVSRIFSNAGYDTVVANDGFEALERLDENTSLVVLDVNMPGLDGYGVCEKLSEMEADFESLPIVFLTSLESKAMELLGREYGAYLNKPVNEAALLETVENLLAQTSSLNSRADTD